MSERKPDARPGLDAALQCSCKIVVKKGNNAKETGDVCPYCGSKDTVLLDDYVDEKNEIASEAWQCGACHATFLREVKLDKDGRTILYSETHAGRHV